MTGFGRGVHVADGVRVGVEIRSVNRKQAEVQTRLPPELEPLESRVREEVLREVSRGRVEVRVDLDLPANALSLQLNRPLAEAYARELGALAKDLRLEGALTLEALLRCPGVLRPGSAVSDADAFWPTIQTALRSAIQDFNATRDREGGALERDLAERIGALRSATARVRERAPAVHQRYREGLLQRLHAAGLEGIQADDERILKELVLFADRSDISEELARLESHFAQFEDCRRSRDPVGRKLDFLAQEIHREVNTIGSKANDAQIAVEVVGLKTELERFREQVQNLE